MCAATIITSVQIRVTALQKLLFTHLLKNRLGNKKYGTSQLSAACSSESETHHKLPVYTSNLHHNDSEAVACRFEGHAASRLLTKQSGTWLGLGRAWWVSDKLHCVTWSAALHSLPIKYSWPFFPSLSALAFENGFKAPFFSFSSHSGIFYLETPDRSHHTWASTDQNVLNHLTFCSTVW